MKKLTFTGLLTALMLFAGTTFGQEVIISDGFEDYADGAKIAQAAQAMGHDYWTTWSGTTGGGEDGTVTTSQKFEGTKSMKIENDNDVILLLSQDQMITSGIYRLSFQTYVPTGKSGYFNILHLFTGDQGSEWVIDVFLNTNGSTNTIAAGKNLTAATYPKDTWFPIVLDFDLNSDTAIFTMNNTVVLGWKFSLVGKDGSQGLRQLHALDFYGSTTVYGGSTPSTTNEAYFDQVVFEQIADGIPPVVTINVDEIMQEIAPNDVGNTQVIIKNEGSGGAADVVGYLEYTPKTSGTETIISLYKGSALTSSGVGGEVGYEKRELAIALSPDDYKIGSRIENIEYYINANINTEYGESNLPGSDLTVKIYGQGPLESVPGDVLATKVYPMSSFVENDWNVIALDESDYVTLTGGFYWVSVSFKQNDKSFPMSTDGGPAVEGGNWSRVNDGAWSRLILSDNSSQNWSIKANGKGILSDPWAKCNKIYHSGIMAGESSTLTITFESKNLEIGEYEATLVFLTNDPDNTRIEVPVTMKVTEEVLNTDSSIKGIFVDGVAATLADGSKTEYWIEIPYTEKVELVVETMHESATVSGDIGEQAVVVGPNVFNFKVIAEDPAYETSYMIEITVGPNSISDIQKALVSIHPNPVQDILYFDSKEQIQNVQIFDLNGRLIQETSVSNNAVNMQELSSGVYLIKISTAEGNVTQKIIKK